jgi:hypothetical protein
LQRVAGIDVFKTKAVVGYAEWFGKLARLLDQIFRSFVVHKSASFLNEKRVVIVRPLA